MTKVDLTFAKYYKWYFFKKKCTHYKLIDTPTISVRPEVDCEVMDVVDAGQIHPPSGDEH